MKQIVKRPLLTEKSLTLAGRGWYAFVVEADATKEQVAAWVNKLYGVTVTEVRTISMHGKARRVGKQRTEVRKPDWKKAMVRLVKGQKIDAFEVTSEVKK